MLICLHLGHFLLFDPWHIFRKTFIFPVILHRSIGTAPPSLFPGKPTRTHQLLPALAEDTQVHTFLHQTMTTACLVGSGVLSETIANNVLHLHLSPKHCKDLPLACYFCHPTCLFASLHYLTASSWFHQTLKFFKRDIYLHHWLYFPIAFSSAVKYFKIRWYLFNCKHDFKTFAMTKAMSGNNFVLLFK